MNTTWIRFTVRLSAVVLFFAGDARSAFGQDAPAMRYLILDGSYLLKDCPICGLVSIEEPMSGTFDLRPLDSTGVSSRYSVENINFTAGTSQHYKVNGSGSFEIGGEVAVTQKMALEVDIDDGTTKKACEFNSTAGPPGRTFPMMDITVTQTNGTLTQTYTLRIAAAPVREIWFSTNSAFTAGAGEESSGFVLGGDLISTTGRVVKRNAGFYTSVGATPPGPDLGLDAVDVLPGGEFAFSLNTGFPMTHVGPIYHGDLLSTAGVVIRRNQELTVEFGIQPPAPDVGLDAVHVLDSGEVLFSIVTDVFSEKLGIQLGHGDPLSSAGKVVRTHQQLLQKFHPPSTSTDYGLDALYLWPGGEIWFSTEQGFTDSTLGPVSAGDLLSDQGYIVLRNAALLASFAPVGAQSDFGLDALYIVTDATTPPGDGQMNLATGSGSPDLILTWQSPARVVQVERSTNLTDPFQPVSPVMPGSDASWIDPAALQSRSRAFYRLHQW